MAPDDQANAVREAMTFRVFVSSTFNDFGAERNAMQCEVWPRLRELCRRHGARFQAIDLRWGVSEEASREQQIMQICLEEIRRCQQVTPRPNFIVLLGDRYGWRPAPEIIPKDEFDAICAHFSDEQREPLDEWYALDQNAVPPEYCLLPRDEVSYEEWQQIESDLHEALLTGARATGLGDDAMVKYERSATEQEIIAGALEAAKGHAFYYQRRINGMPMGPEAEDYFDLDDQGRADAEARALLHTLRRSLRDFMPRPHRRRIVARWGANGPTDEHLDALCVQVYLDLAGVILSQIAGMEAVDPLDHEVEQHRKFAQDRACHFIGRKQIIERITGYAKTGGGYPLVVHGKSGSGKSALMARVLKELPEDLTVIWRFIGATPASTQHHALLRGLCEELYREFGFAALEDRWREEQREGAQAGLEPEERPQNPYEVPATPNELAKAFERFLGSVPQDRTLVIVLDALDQLSPEGSAHSLYWLPVALPENVRIVASVLEREDETGACYRTAQRKLRSHKEAFIPLPELTVDEGEAILGMWLEKVGRELQKGQREDLMASFEAAPDGHALFLRLAFEEARHWRFFDSRPRTADVRQRFSNSVEGLVEDMLARLEQPANHGPVLVERALSYLWAARNGLSEHEMLDVLSADADVWAWVETGAHHKLIERRLPPVIWSRLYFDLRPYLTERAADGTSLLGFYHRQVSEVVEERYLDDNGDRQRAYRRLGDYFGKQDPWLEAEARTANLRRASELAWQQTRAEDWDGLEATLTDLQSMEAKTEGGMVFDLATDLAAAYRALSPERPWTRNIGLLDQAVRSDLQFIASHPTTLFQCLWNSAWWYDCDEAAKHYDAPEGGWGPEGAQWERDEPRLATLLERWRREKEEREPGFAWVRSLRPLPSMLGGAELACLSGHREAVYRIAFSPDGEWLFSGSRMYDFIDNCVRVWDVNRRCEVARLDEESPDAVLPNGMHLMSRWDEDGIRIRDETGNELAFMEGSMFRSADTVTSPEGTQSVSLWPTPLSVRDARTDEEMVVLGGYSGRVESICWSSDGSKIVAGCGDHAVRLWDAASGKQLACLRGHGDVVCAVAFSPTDDCIASGGGGGSETDNTVRLWDASYRGEMPRLRGHSAPVLALARSVDGALLASGAGERQYLRGGDTPDSDVRVWDVASGEEVVCMRGHPSPVRSIAFSSDGRLIASGAGRDFHPRHGEVRLWDARTGMEIARLLGHETHVSAVAFTPDGRRLISAEGRSESGEGMAIRMWDVPTGDELGGIHAWAPVGLSLAISPDGRFVVCGGHGFVWDTESFDTFPLPSSDYIRGVAFSPDGQHIACGTDDGSVWIFDAYSGYEEARAQGQGGTVWAIAFSPDGSRIASGSRAFFAASEETVCILEAEHLECLTSIHGRGDVVALSNAPGECRWGAIACDREVVIEDRIAEKEIAWLSFAPYQVLTFANCRIWAGEAGTYVGFILLEGPPEVREPRTVTATRLWLHGKHHVQSKQTDAGRWDAHLTTLCPWHGGRFEVTEDMLGSEIDCPECGQPLRINDFVCDWSDRI